MIDDINRQLRARLMDWTLFGSALRSSTLFPSGFEALLLYRLHQGADPLDAVTLPPPATCSAA